MDRRGDDGPSHVSIGGYIEKSERPLGIGSLTTRTVVQDGPSWERRSVSCGRWWTLGEKFGSGVLGQLERT